MVSTSGNSILMSEVKKISVSVEKEQALWQMLRQTCTLIQKARQLELGKYDISVETSAILFTILRLGEQATPGEIARQLSLERHTASEHLIRMEKDGLITRTRDLRGKGRVSIELTDKGYQKYVQSSRRRSTKKIVSMLTDSEQAQLWILMARLRDSARSQLGLKEVTLYPPSDPTEM